MSRRHVLAFSLAGVFLMAGCSASVAAPTADPSPMVSAVPSVSSSDPVCAAEAKLKASIDNLKSLGRSDGISGLQTAVNDIGTNVSALRTAAQGQFEPQIDGLTTSLSKLKTSLGTLASSPSTSALTGVVGDATAVVTAFDTLQNAVADRCPS